MASTEPSATSASCRERPSKRRASRAAPQATTSARAGAMVALACTFDQSAATGSASQTSGPSRSSASRYSAKSGQAKTCARVPNDSSSAIPENATQTATAVGEAPRRTPRYALSASAAVAHKATPALNTSQAAPVRHTCARIPKIHSCGTHGAPGALNVSAPSAVGMLPVRRIVAPSQRCQPRSPSRPG